jgi:hypothetical protein
MKRAHLRSSSRRRIQKLLSTTSNGSAGSRIEAISSAFLGVPYSSTLIGNAETPEVFVVSFDAFDCVTYMETVLALALASDPAQFEDLLRKIRYDKGRIEWRRRNHYMTHWIRNNMRDGIVRRIAARIPRTGKVRTLDILPGLPPVKTRFECVPKRAISLLAPYLRTGDLIFFASTRRHLDIFHCGLLIRNGERLLLRHASRSRKGVVEQELGEFLKDNRMAGVIVVRPVRDHNREDSLSR